jgi:hypothetical protein
MRRTAIGVPSDWYCNSYFLPFWSTAVQEMLESSSVTKFPACLQRPVANSIDGQAIDLWPILGFQQHPVDRQLIHVGVRPSSVVTGKRNDVTVVPGVVDRDREIRPAFLGLGERHGPAGQIPPADLERPALAGHHREDDGIGLRPRQFALRKSRHCNEGDGKGESLPVECHSHAPVDRTWRAV